jgi:hypothetical protein
MKRLCFCKLFFAKKTNQQNTKHFSMKLSINFTSNAKSLSSFSGLKLFSDQYDRFEIKKIFSPYLPKLKKIQKLSSSDKFFSGVFVFGGRS